jgi:photosystem II stability/assembly factor-like uncharacterized protein
MKKLVLISFSLLWAAALMAQPTVYNWVPQTLSPDNNLQELTVMDDNSLVVVGYNNSFFKSTDQGLTWNPVKVVYTEFDFTSLSMNSSGVGLLSSRFSKIIDYKSGEDVVVSGKLLKTNDYGVTWSVMDLAGIGVGEPDSLNPNRTGCFSFDLYTVGCVDANNLFAYVGWKDMTSGSKVSAGAVYETKDGGATWTSISGDLGSKVITAIQTAGTNTFVAGNNTMFKKSGDVVTDLFPALVTANNDDASIYIFDIDVVSETEFYIVSTSDGIFKTTDAGDTFTKMGGTGVPAGGNDIKKINENTIMVLGISARSKVTVDGGTTWTGCYPGASCWEISGVFGDSVVATAKDDIYKIAVADLATNPTNWKKQNITDKGNIQQIHIIDADKAILAGTGQVVKSTSDKGQTWSDVNLPVLSPIPGDDNAEYEIDFKGICTSDGVSYANTRRFYFVDYPTSSPNVDLYFSGLIFTSKDNWETSEMVNLMSIGAKYETDPTKNPFHANCYGFEPFSIECVTDSILYLWGQWNDTTAGFDNKETHSYIFRTTDSLATWDIVTENLGNRFVTDIHFVDKDNGYIAGNRTLLKTTDGGETFVNLYETLDPGEVEGMFINAIVYMSDEEIYLPTTADSVWLTTDGGQTFTAVPGVPGGNDFLKLSDTHMLSIGTVAKSFLTWNAGAEWEACSPGVSVWALGGIVNDEVLALTKGDIYKIAVAELLAKTDDDDDDTVSVKELITEAGLKILNRADEIEVLSAEQQIDHCILYSITGKVMEERKQQGVSCIFRKSSYAPGVYIISTYTANKRYTHKVVF